MGVGGWVWWRCVWDEECGMRSGEGRVVVIDGLEVEGVRGGLWFANLAKNERL